MGRRHPSPFGPMWMLFGGFGLSVAIGLAGSAAVYLTNGATPAREFLHAFTTDFQVLVSLGLAIGTALVVYRLQHIIPDVIEKAFTPSERAATNYADEKRRFESRRRTVQFAGELLVVAFPLFAYCRFPLAPVGADIMIGIGCLEYVLGSYVGRKLRYASMMLDALREIPIKRNLFRHRELDKINVCVNVASTLTIVVVYAHVTGYYGGPFRFDSFVGDSIKPLLLFPAVIATPVLLIFNFYPRSVLRKIYGQSIDVELRDLRETLREEKLSAFEKRSHLMQFDKMCRDEVQNSVQLRLSDIPIAITVIGGIVQLLVRGR